jgi:hypothetical protein
MKRKFTLTFGFIFLFTSLLTPLSSAAAKAGAKCTKVNTTSTVSGFKYTCIKSGKKLIWSKGVAVSPVENLPAATLQGPTSFDDLIQNYQGISYAAWNKSRQKILSSSKTDISLKFVLGPTTQLTFKDPLYSINLISRLYAGYPISSEISFLAFNYDDRNWAVNQMESIIPNSGSGWITDVACATKSTCWGGGAFSDGASKYLIVEAMGVMDTNHTSGTVEAHEFTHIVQQMVIKKNRPAQEFLYDPWPPTWYWEGQAHFAQNASIYFDSYSTYLRERRNTSQDLYRNSAFNSEHIRKYFVFNAPEDWQNNYQRWQQYDLGAMFVEVLTAIKGPDATMQMWKLAKDGIKFEEAFETVYGTPYSKALPIMAKAIALQLGRN